MNKTDVDAYLRDGCGRCEDYQTPACKVHRWADGLVRLRALLLDSGLTETLKWGSPCYTLAGKNVVMIFAFRESFGLTFFKGAAFADFDDLLEPAGPNSRHACMLRFKMGAEIVERHDRIREIVKVAIGFERSGEDVKLEAGPEVLPRELEARLESDEALRQAFEALTPGRRRSHVLHVSGAKQESTRIRRVDQCIPAIMAGRGHQER